MAGSKSKTSRAQGDQRTDAQRDRDRILYSSAFRRLAGVTQVATFGERRLLHNRLTHSMKTAQVCVGIYLDRSGKQSALVKDLGLDRDVLEAGGLAHDLGHPPYGHVGEAALHELVRIQGGLATQRERTTGIRRNYEGFEGNAQTFRIVTKLATKSGARGRSTDVPVGLDLSDATLSAMLKYPLTDAELRSRSRKPHGWTERRGREKWGVYASEKDILHSVAGSSADRIRSASAIIVDWADDITYAVHDLEDFYRAGLVPLHNLDPHWGSFLERAQKRLGKNPGFDPDAFVAAAETVRSNLKFDSPFQNTRAERARLHRWASTRITRYVEAVQLEERPPSVRIATSRQYEVLALKELTWYFVIDSPALATQQVGHRRAITELFGVFFGWVEEDPHHPRIPVALRETFDTAQEDIPDDRSEYRCARAVADFIADLTEVQVADLYGRLVGHEPGSIFGLWLQ